MNLTRSQEKVTGFVGKVVAFTWMAGLAVIVAKVISDIAGSLSNGSFTRGKAGSSVAAGLQASMVLSILMFLVMMMAMLVGVTLQALAGGLRAAAGEPFDADGYFAGIDRTELQLTLTFGIPAIFLVQGLYRIIWLKDFSSTLEPGLAMLALAAAFIYNMLTI